MKTFPIGSVGHTLQQMHGIWHDYIELFELNGTPLGDDTQAGSGTPGASPFTNLVYIDFDGENFKLTNVPYQGRPLNAKTFTGTLVEGLMVFDPLGPGAYENIGMSGGPGILTFNSRYVEKACEIYMEPDFIYLINNNTRLRHTVLYRDGVATRTLTAKGKRLSHTCDKRLDIDPRGTNGPVHEAPFVTRIWSELA